LFRYGDSSLFPFAECGETTFVSVPVRQIERGVLDDPFAVRRVWTIRDRAVAEEWLIIRHEGRTRYSYAFIVKIIAEDLFPTRSASVSICDPQAPSQKRPGKSFALPRSVSVYWCSEGLSGALANHPLNLSDLLIDCLADLDGSALHTSQMCQNLPQRALDRRSLSQC
jgi:hypothetical protein